MDNDQDGPVDCDDDGCAAATACVGDDDDATDDDDDVDACAAAVPCNGSFEFDEAALCESISDNLFVVLTEGITSINLPCLTSVGDLWVETNDALTNLDGLSSLTSVVGAIWIFQNPALTDISGLSGVTSVGGHLHVHSNPLLCQSFVDTFFAACSCGSATFYDNDDGC